MFTTRLFPLLFPKGEGRKPRRQLERHLRLRGVRRVGRPRQEEDLSHAVDALQAQVRKIMLFLTQQGFDVLISQVL